MKHICRDLEPHHEHFVLYEGNDNDDDFRARFHKLHSSGETISLCPHSQVYLFYLFIYSSIHIKMVE